MCMCVCVCTVSHVYCMDVLIRWPSVGTDGSAAPRPPSLGSSLSSQCSSSALARSSFSLLKRYSLPRVVRNCPRHLTERRHPPVLQETSFGEALWSVWTFVADAGECVCVCFFKGIFTTSLLFSAFVVLLGSHAETKGLLVRVTSLVITLGGMFIFALMVLLT